MIGSGDADWAGRVKARKSTYGACSFLGNNWVSWFSIEQNNNSLSTSEAEYNNEGSSHAQMIWMNQMLYMNNVQQVVMATCVQLIL